MSMWFSHNGISVPARETPINPDAKVDGFPSSIHRYHTSRDFNARPSQSRTEAEDRRLWLSCASALFLNSGSEKE